MISIFFFQTRIKETQTKSYISQLTAHEPEGVEIEPQDTSTSRPFWYTNGAFLGRHGVTQLPVNTDIVLVLSVI